ncbi:transcription factor E2F3 [Gouania willdenowi]|uniref:transcription factor E2F3 n=1 Tax=Gouania willdenowi TaxID=441366 RepID=UPI00105457A0|nr:transcription factor E2F3-like [Gouania willdenowi]
MEETCKTAPKDPICFDNTTLGNVGASNGCNVSIEPSMEKSEETHRSQAKRKLLVIDPEELQNHSQSSTIKRCILSVPSQTDDSTYTASKMYDKKSLCYLGMKFMTLLKQSTDGELDLNQVSQMLEAPKRRIYDITNVLQGINLVKKKSKSVIKWHGGHLDPKHAVADLVEEEWRLDELIASCTEELYQLFQEHNRYAYLIHEDVSKMESLKDQTIIVIKAPAETKVEVAHPHERLQVHVCSTLGPIDVFTCSEGSGPTEKAAGLYSAVSGND